MRCLWCSSPQTQNAFPEILHRAANCQKCGDCLGVCPSKALTISETDALRIDRGKCTNCGECAEVCPNRALELVGRYVTVEELVEKVNRDTAFYRRSEGGITVGGGELTMQNEFATELLKRLKSLYVHTAIETCGYTRWTELEKLLRYVDLVYFDIKHMDPRKHGELTGVSNEHILENARRTSALRPTILRVPAVPGYNDSDVNIRQITQFAAASGKNLRRVELLPYHEFGVQTYAELGRTYRLVGVKPPSSSRMDKLKKIVESYGVIARIGG